MQRRGDKRRRGAATGRLVFALGHHIARPGQRVAGRQRVGFVIGPELLAVNPPHLEARLLLCRIGQVGVNLPVFFGHEHADFALALDDQAHGHRLHPPRGEPARHLRPQQGGDHVTHHPVQEAARLLGIHPGQVDSRGPGKGVLNRLPGDFVEHHALVALVVATDGFAQMPGDGFSLAIEVGREIDRIGLVRQPAQLRHHFFLARENLVVGLPARIGIDAHAPHKLLAGLLRLVPGLVFGRQSARFGRLRRARFGIRRRAAAGRGQVADVAHAGLDDKLFAQIFVDRARFGRRFDND